MRRNVLAVVLVGLVSMLFAVPAHAQFASPFEVAAELHKGADGNRVAVTFKIPDDHYLYADQIAVAAGDVKLLPEAIPPPKQKHDAFLDKVVGIYEHDVTFVYRPASAAEDLTLTVAYQGCSGAICFRPTTETIRLGTAGADGAATVAETVAAAGTDWQAVSEGFSIAGSASGFVKADALVDFVAGSLAGEARGDRLRTALEQQGIWVVALLILVGGLLLNLTPCVLPMIPVNIAIIGAGAQAGSRARGFALGGLYGLGIALVYGVLGLVVMLTGSKFGALNASPWFNLGIAVVFLVLALAMFDVFIIDLSRFQRAGGPSEGKRGGFATALILGGVAALLAGACVAPVVISVLLLAADLHHRSQPIGLFLPFLLGVGMALPWPFAGAGLSFLPRPGKWMGRVKGVFGVVIVLFALWYGKLGVSLLMARAESSRAAVVAAQEAQAEHGWRTALEPALAEAREAGKPVFIDFWASWCKNCLKMEKTTFRDPAVTAALEPFVRVKAQAEDINAADVKAMLDHFGVIGLPTYVVLVPVSE